MAESKLRLAAALAGTLLARTLLAGTLLATPAPAGDTTGGVVAAALPGTLLVTPGTPAGLAPPASSSECCWARGALAFGS